MNTYTEPVFELTAREEAARLWHRAREVLPHAAKSVVALTECLDLGLRAAEVLAFDRLHPHRTEFAGTIALMLEPPAPEVVPDRDAIEVPTTLRLNEVLDLLSVDGLSCIGPLLHRGWEDRRFSCQRARETARKAAGCEIDAELREPLLWLAAYRNRIFRYPPPLRIVRSEIVDALPALEQLIDKLAVGTGLFT